MNLTDITKMSVDQIFRIKGEPERFKIILNPDTNNQELKHLADGNWDTSASYYLPKVIRNSPHNIVKVTNILKDLTELEKEQLRCIYTLGGRYLARDYTGYVYAYFEKPIKVDRGWRCSDFSEKSFQIFSNLEVYHLLKCEDSKPIEIANYV